MELKMELKPCPFCGGEASINDDPTGNGGKPITRGRIGLGRLWSVECDECGADAGYWQGEEIAVLAWNTRAERTCRMDYVGYIGTEESHASIYQCSKCSMRYMSANVPDSGEYCMACGAKVVE